MKKSGKLQKSAAGLLVLGVLGAFGGLIQASTASAEVDLFTPALRAFEEREYSRPESAFMKGTVLTIDTRDQETCRKMEADLGIRTSPSICDNTDDESRDRPLVSIVRVEQISSDQYIGSVRCQREDGRAECRLPNPHLPENINPNVRKVFKDTGSVMLVGLATFGALIAMPPSFSMWDTSNKAQFIKEMPQRWSKKVKAGPVVDHDKWYVNYIGHPVAGAYYYQVARHDGLGWKGALGYSALMSTFFWEYGVEAFAEIPSLQDLFITPLIGSLMGELFYQMETRIDANGGKVLGSKILGRTIKILLNPAGALVRGMDRVKTGLKRRYGLEGYTSVVGYPVQNVADPRELNEHHYYMGLQFNIRWK